MTDPVKHEMPVTAARTLADWWPRRSHDREFLGLYRAFAADPATLSRETSPAEHLTASSFVLSADLTHVLLCFHRKGGFWVQFGGHVEPGDASLFAAARREAVEESGLDVPGALTALREEPVDLDRHALSGAFGTCRVHWDVGFALTAAPDAATRVSEESEDVAWWPVDALPAGSVPGLDRRVGRVVRTLREG